MTPGEMRRLSVATPAPHLGHEPIPPLPRISLARWREVAPALIARADGHLPIAEIWLPSLLNDLDRRFDLPLEIADVGSVRTLTALGFVRYTIDRQAQSVSSTLLATELPKEIKPAAFDMVCAWHRVGWLRPLLESLPTTRLIDTLLPETHRAGVMKWLAFRFEPLLRRDERFRRLRRELRQALCFDASLFRLALRSQGRRGPAGLSGAELTEVWRHESHLRVVEKDAPRLLPLAYAMLGQLVEAPASDVVKRLKARLAVDGLTDAGWRYLLRYGHRPICAIGGGSLKLSEVAKVAQALAMAGGHPPPSLALRVAWAPRFVPIPQFGATHKDSILTWLRSERRLACAILKAANEAKNKPHYAQFVDDITCVLWWLRDAKIATPSKSLRSLIRAAKAWEADQLAIAQLSRRRWSKPRTIAGLDEIHEAVLLEGPVAVLEEARVMRNCLRVRLPILKSRSAQVWSVRTKASGERVALIELRRDHARWKLHEVAARFNRPAAAWVRPFAESLAVLETLRLERTKGA